MYGTPIDIEKNTLQISVKYKSRRSSSHITPIPQNEQQLIINNNTSHNNNNNMNDKSPLTLSKSSTDDTPIPNITSPITHNKLSYVF